MHNFSAIGLPGADGKDVQTTLVDSSQSASVTFTPQQAGAFMFQCGVHPADMTGTLTVK
ncbi:MAG TPA: plastocyanin/azurin family copper-binding protein [Dehalococcoidia bacterium]|nr:plastocyanin/azurin family copper-binding protein [Dehalococcoidia bacterium]